VRPVRNAEAIHGFEEMLQLFSFVGFTEVLDGLTQQFLSFGDERNAQVYKTVVSKREVNRPLWRPRYRKGMIILKCV
jgi:hypothetical protein